MKKTNKLTKRETEIATIIYQKTKEALVQNRLDEVGYDAMNISLDLVLDRANVSRILNNLCRHGYLSKIIGRPTLYISRTFINEIKKDKYIPEVFHNIDNFISYFSAYKMPINIDSNPFHKLIGYQEHESIYSTIKKLEAALLYPPYGLPMMISAPAGSGKKTIANCLFQFAISKHLLKCEDDLIYLDARLNTFALEINETLKPQQRRKKRMLIVNNFDLMKEEESTKVINRISEKDNGSFFWVFLSSQCLDNMKHLPLISFVPSIVELIPYSNKTIKEKFTFVIALFQNEANLIQRTIRLNKNIINCFVMSDYFHNSYVLKKEIKLTLALTLQNTQDSILEINLANISDEVLFHIHDVNNHVDELYRIYLLIGMHTIHLLPNVPCKVYERLLNQVVYNEQLVITENQNIFVQNEIRTIESQCKLDIKQCMDKEITQFNSMGLGLIYEVVYPFMEKLNMKNDHYMIGLLAHLNKVIDDIHEGIYMEDVSSNLETIESQVYEMALRVEETFHVVLPYQELLYVHFYLKYAQLIDRGSRIGVLFLCSSSNISKNYAQYANILKCSITAEYLDAQTLILEKGSSQMQSFIQKLDDGKGILILSDEELEKSLLTYIQEKVTDVLCISSINIHQIPVIMKMAERIDTFLDDFLCFTMHQQDVEINVSEDEEGSFLDIIHDEVLEKSLTFLNPNKIVNLALASFRNIIADLRINYSEILVVKFVVHSAFMVERVIRNDWLAYKKMGEFIKQNHLIFHIVEKNILNMNDQLGVLIPQSEIVYLTEIFLAELNDSPEQRIY